MPDAGAPRTPLLLDPPDLVSDEDFLGIGEAGGAKGSARLKKTVDDGHLAAYVVIRHLLRAGARWEFVLDALLGRKREIDLDFLP